MDPMQFLQYKLNMVIRMRSPTYSSSTPSAESSVSLEEIEAIAMENENESPDVPWPNTFNMRPLTLAALSLGRPTPRTSQNPLNRMRCRNITSAAKSLDILRQNLQSTINKEIDVVIRKYLETFFEPAVDNVRKNLGVSSVSEDLVKEVCRTMLEEAKQMYCAGFNSALHRGSSPLSEPELQFRTSDQMLPRKRKCSDTDSESSSRKRASPQISKWDPSRVTKETQFILSTTAGKCLGLGSLRGRLCVKHPDLVRYTLDQDDREWLGTARVQGLSPTIPSTYLMFLDDIIELYNSDDYRNSPNLLLSELKGFEIPDFIQRKVRAHMAVMRTKYIVSSQSSDGSEASTSAGVGVECVSSTMTPPSVIDSDLVELQSPYLSLASGEEED